MNAQLLLDSLSERREIEDNKLFARHAERTQVLVPQHGRDEVAKNRATHSYEVATSSLTIAAALAKSIGVDLFSIDYKASLYNVSLLHDIGHPPFGHDGADFLDRIFKQKGIEEGFSDNNNNLVAIKKNQINVRDYTLASIIKYPDALYPYQKPVYLPMLEQAISEDISHFATLGVKFANLTRTITCQIMDDGDTNSYSFSDMSDFLCNGSKIPESELRDISKHFHFSANGKEMVDEFIDVSGSGNKSLIKSHLSKRKEQLNLSYAFCDTGIRSTDRDLVMFREFVNRLTKIYYIRPIRKLPFHLENMDKFQFIINQVVSERFLPSKHYSSIILNTQDEKEKLRAMRDMIAETSDWYVLTQYEKLNP